MRPKIFHKILLLHSIGYGRIVQIVPKSGYAFVELEDAKDAADAVRDLDGRPMAGRE